MQVASQHSKLPVQLALTSNLGPVGEKFLFRLNRCMPLKIKAKQTIIDLIELGFEKIYC